MTNNLKIILSPTKTMNTKKNCSNLQDSFPFFLDKSIFLIKELRNFSIKELSDTMNISSKIAELNYHRFKKWCLANTCYDKWIPAASIYSGEAYKGLDYNSLSEKNKLRAHKSLFILSGLYGILRANDRIYPYRLEMGLKWKISSQYDNLYRYWENNITQYLNSNLSSNDILINLASQEYYKAIKQKEIKNLIITPVFKTFKNGSYKTIAIHSKLARGLMSRYIIENNINNTNELKRFEEGGYFYNDKLSSEKEIVFIK